MKTKAQKAALLKVESLIVEIESLIQRAYSESAGKLIGRSLASYGTGGFIEYAITEHFEKECKEIEQMVACYGLKKQVIATARKKIYKALIKKGAFGIASEFAKKYNL